MISIRRSAFPLLAASILGLFASVAEGKVFTLSKQELTDYSSQNPFERYPDGRPKVPDEIIDRARALSSIGDVMLTGINIPIQIGNTTVMPGDLVVGDREGVYFIPPQFVKSVLDQADEIHIHDEWTKKKFAEGKYKSGKIYPSPSDPKLQQEYKEYFKKELEEIAKKRKAQ